MAFVSTQAAPEKADNLPESSLAEYVRHLDAAMVTVRGPEPKAGAMMSTALSLAMLVSLALIGGAFYLWRRPGYRRQAVLMLVAAAVALFNVAIWTLPDGEGRSPVGQLANGQ